eukprot:1750926-Pyramimonas_sp.AAC.1
MGGGDPCGPSTGGAFGGAPYVATKRVRGVPTWVAVTHVDPAPGAFGGAPHRATSRVSGLKQEGWEHDGGSDGDDD